MKSFICEVSEKRTKTCFCSFERTSRQETKSLICEVLPAGRQGARSRSDRDERTSRQRAKPFIYIVSLLVLVTIGLTGCSLGQSKMADQVTVNYTSDDGLEVKVKEVKTNKSTYHSHEDLTIAVALESIQQSGEVLLEISGLRDGYGDDHISQKKLLEVSAAAETKYVQTFSLPECSACAGFPEGEYIITVVASQTGQKLAEKKTTFMFQP